MVALARDSVNSYSAIGFSRKASAENVTQCVSALGETNLEQVVADRKIGLAIESSDSRIRFKPFVFRFGDGCFADKYSPSVEWHFIPRSYTLLTEATVEKMFRQMMNDPKRSEETFDKAEELLEDELRPESPLRHRLSVELEELRVLATTQEG